MHRTGRRDCSYLHDGGKHRAPVASGILYPHTKAVRTGCKRSETRRHGRFQYLVKGAIDRHQGLPGTHPGIVPDEKLTLLHLLGEGNTGE